MEKVAREALGRVDLLSGLVAIAIDDAKSLLKERLVSSAVSALRADSFSIAASPDGVQRRLRGAPNRPASSGWQMTRAVKGAGATDRSRRQHQQACGATKRLDSPGAAHDQAAA